MQVSAVSKSGSLLPTSVSVWVLIICNLFRTHCGMGEELAWTSNSLRLAFEVLPSIVLTLIQYPNHSTPCDCYHSSLLWVVHLLVWITGPQNSLLDYGKVPLVLFLEHRLGKIRLHHCQ